MTLRRAVSSSIDARALAETGQPVTITRTGQFHDPRYGQFEITPAMLSDMVKNFDAQTYGQTIFVDIGHNPDGGAAGEIRRLWIGGDKLLADVQWTPYGKTAITERGYQYLSAEYHENFIDNERRLPHGAVLLGAALTIRPAIKRLDPIQLSEPLALHGRLRNRFLIEAQLTMNKHLLELQKTLAETKLAPAVVTQLSDAYLSAAAFLGDDDKALSDLAQRMADTGKRLAESLGDKPAVIQLTIPPAESKKTDDAKTLSEADVKRLLAEDRAAVAAQQKTLAESLATKQAQFKAALDADEAIKLLKDDERELLYDASLLINEDSAPEQVKALAEQQIKLGYKIGVNRQLANLGYALPKGSMHISLGAYNGPMQLQEKIDAGLRDSYSAGHLRLTEEKKLKPHVRRVLAEFDRTHGAELAGELRQLADGGAGTVSNMVVPSGFQRTVIREALSDLSILDVVQVTTDPSAQATTQIPYETRLPGAIVADGIVAEGAEIPRASVQQRMDTAYVNAMKLSMSITNEIMHFSRSALIDWDAYARNIASNSRLMQELVARRIANTLQRNADSYGAVAVTATSIASQLTGTQSIIKTASWPVVRPFQERNLQGGAIGSVVHPITIVVNTATITQYDGSGSQADGTYWTPISYNLGLFRLVDEAGVAVTPTASTTTTIAYSYATNVAKFDLKLPSGVLLPDHMDGVLRAIGARKEVLNSTQYVLPDFLLMSGVLNDQLTNARQFTESGRREGSGLSGIGDLMAVRGIPTYGTNAPQIDLKDDRIIMGPRGVLSYTIVKPFMTGVPFEAVGANGLPTGTKVAYGEEYNAIHVPSPIRGRLTSIIVYDSDARTAAT